MAQPQLTATGYGAPSILSDAAGWIGERVAPVVTGVSDWWLGDSSPVIDTASAALSDDPTVRQEALDRAAMAGGPFSVAADAHRYHQFPEERTPGNIALSVADVVPGVGAASKGLGWLAPSLAGLTAWHGSPHLFDRFDISKIGTGEGAQMYGHGLYFAELKDVAMDYWNKLAGRKLRTPEGDELDPETLVRSTLPQSAQDAGYTKHYTDLLTHGGPGRWQQEADDLTHLAKYGRNELVRQDAADRLNWVRSMQGGFRSARGGALYEVDIDDDAIDRMLDWDAPIAADNVGREAFLRLREHDFVNPLKTREATELRSYVPERLHGHVDDLINGTISVDDWNELRVAAKRRADVDGDTLQDLAQGASDYLLDLNEGRLTGQDLARALHSTYGDTEAARIMHEDIGLPGIKYLDQHSRYGHADEQTRNFVLFDDSLVKILEKHLDD